jgi:hypothetical protein
LGVSENDLPRAFCDDRNRDKICRAMNAKVTTKLDKAERQRQLHVLREIAASSVLRSHAEVDTEIADLRESRHSSGRRHPAESAHNGAD